MKRDVTTQAEVDFGHYWTLDEIYAYVEDLAANNPRVTVLDIGTTAEGRTIKALTISSTGQVSKSRPVVFMDSGIHAR